MKINIVSLFDKSYLVRAVAMLDSARESMPEAYFYFLCTDEESKAMLEKMKLERVFIITLEDTNDKELIATKKERSQAEFSFTAKSAFLNYLATRPKVKEGDALVWTDADIIYFSSLVPLIKRMVEAKQSIGITPHRFPKEKEYMNEKVGKYNAGFALFIVNENSRACIANWRRQCIEWCYLRYEEDRLGDQLYMNKWHENYPGVYDIPDKGVNIGSWSIFNYKIEERQKGKFYIDDDLLVCYHFHRIKFYVEGKHIKPLPIYIYNERLYGIYVDKLEKAWNKLSNIKENWSDGFTEKPDFLRLIKQKVERKVRNILRR